MYIVYVVCIHVPLPAVHVHCKYMYAGKTMFADHCEALELAVEYMREQTGNPEFSLGIDPYADVSTLSQRKATPNHSDKSHTPRNKAAESRSKSSSLTRSKRGRNGCVMDPTANSPVLADDERSSERMKLESSKRKRSRDSVGTEGDERATADAKRQRTNTNESEHLSGKKEERKESDKDVVPRRLDFSDEGAVDGQGGPASVHEGSPQEVPPNSSREDLSTFEAQIPHDSSPVSKAEHQPSSPRGGSLSNDLPSSELPSLDPVEASKGESIMPVEGDKGEEGQRQGEAERGEAGGLPCSSKAQLEDDEDDVISTEAGEGSVSDSDDDSMPAIGFEVKEDLTCEQN